MNELNTENRVRVLSALVQGNSINSVVRMTGVAKHTILKLLEIWDAPVLRTTIATFAVCAPGGFSGMKSGSLFELR